MSLLENIKWKIQRAGRLITDGRYKDLLRSVYANMPVFLNHGKLKDTMKYMYLRRKYRPFIAEQISAKLRTGGGAHLMIMSSGGCGFKARTTPPTYAKRAWPH